MRVYKVVLHIKATGARVSVAVPTASKFHRVDVTPAGGRVEVESSLAYSRVQSALDFAQVQRMFLIDKHFIDQFDFEVWSMDAVQAHRNGRVIRWNIGFADGHEEQPTAEVKDRIGLIDGLISCPRQLLPDDVETNQDWGDSVEALKAIVVDVV